MSKHVLDFFKGQFPVGEKPSEYPLEKPYGFMIPNEIMGNWEDKQRFIRNFKVAFAKLIDPRVSERSFDKHNAPILPIYFLRGINGKCALVFPSEAKCRFFIETLDAGLNCNDLKSLEWYLNDTPPDNHIRIKMSKMMEDAEKPTTAGQLFDALDTIRGGSKRKTPRRFRKSRRTRKSRKSRRTRRS
jgi:hypothetical protein